MMKFITAQDVFNSIADDLRVYDDEGLIDYSTLIKVLKTCNSELSIKINPESKALVTITDYKGKLPDNFVALDLALLCSRKVIDNTKPSGFQLEHVTTSKCENKCSVCLEECDVDYKVVQRCDKEYLVYDELDIVNVVTTNYKYINKGCVNIHSKSGNEIKLQGDYIHSNFRDGTVYLEYTSSMEDDEGNLLVLDDDIVRPYYEWACKEHIFDMLTANNDDDTFRKWQVAERKHNQAKARARQHVGTPEYDELLHVLSNNRRKFINRYVMPFKNNFHGGINYRYRNF